MGVVLFVWTAAYQTCLMRACVPRLFSDLYQLFDLCSIKHVVTVWPLTSTLACFVTKQCLMVFGRQQFIVCPGPFKSFGGMFDGLQILSNTTKHDLTRSNSTKQGANGKMFGHQRIFDSVWSPNVSRLSRP